jgi:hypothetical protein
VPVEDRQHLEVLGPAGGLLGADDVARVGDRHHLDIADPHAVGVPDELLVATGEPDGVKVRLNSLGLGQMRFQTARAPREAASCPNGRPAAADSVRVRSPRSVRASGRRDRFSRLGSGVRSMSRAAGMGDCWAGAAKAPTTT